MLSRLAKITLASYRFFFAVASWFFTRLRWCLDGCLDWGVWGGMSVGWVLCDCFLLLLFFLHPKDKSGVSIKNKRTEWVPVYTRAWTDMFVFIGSITFSPLWGQIFQHNKPTWQAMDIDCYLLSYLPLSLLQSFPFYSSSLVFQHRYCCHSCLPYLCGRSLGPLPACLFSFSSSVLVVHSLGPPAVLGPPAAASSSASWPPCSWPLIFIFLTEITSNRFQLEQIVCSDSGLCPFSWGNF